jgi:hypothetical protein
MASEELSPGPRSALRRSTTRGSNQSRRSPCSVVTFSKATLPSGSDLAIASNVADGDADHGKLAPLLFFVIP